jgi:hypothetical protein
MYQLVRVLGIVGLPHDWMFSAAQLRRSPSSHRSTGRA